MEVIFNQHHQGRLRFDDSGDVGLNLGDFRDIQYKQHMIHNVTFERHTVFYDFETIYIMECAHPRLFFVGSSIEESHISLWLFYSSIKTRCFEPPSVVPMPKLSAALPVLSHFRCHLQWLPETQPFKMGMVTSISVYIYIYIYIYIHTKTIYIY